jgi:uncharacterized pyridoxamine 5'-phosphate oxidase family protein
MNYLKEFEKIMLEQNEIALATAVEDVPNVRIVNFYFDKKKKGILYFSSFSDNEKIREFIENPIVAFTTIPKSSTKHVRVQKGKVQKSTLTIFDLKEEFSKKIHGYRENIEQFGKQLELYEIHFLEATVIIDFTSIETITL